MVFATFFTSVPAMLFAVPEKLLIFDNVPAERWDYGYGVGNGRLGALTFGGFPKDTIVLNEESIFAKQPLNIPKNPAAALKRAQKLCDEGKYNEADGVFLREILLKTSVSGSYQQGGLLDVEFLDVPAKTHYRRELDLEKGIARTEIGFSDGKILCELLSDPINECVVYRISTTRAKLPEIKFNLRHPKFKAVENAAGGTFSLEGEGTHGGTKFRNDLRIKKINAKEIIVFSSTTTDYNFADPSAPLSRNLAAENKKILDAAEKKTWSTLAGGTEKYFSERMNRCEIDIADSPAAVRELSTRERVARMKKGEEDPDLVELVFQFGRFCVIANSRPGSLPCGLQGLWNPDMNAPWRGCYFFNINCEMNYWPTLTTGLGEFHRPFTDFVLGLKENGEAFAKRLGHEGFAFAHNSDCWGITYYSGAIPEHAANLMNGAWICAHLLEDYRFSGDKAYLKKSFPLIESTANFILSWFSPNEKGEYLPGPGTSPEVGFFYKNAKGEKKSGFVSRGSSFDLLLGREALRNYLFACKELGKTGKKSAEAARVLEKIPLPEIASDGRLKEWRVDLAGEMQKGGHRHFSHLYGIFPGNEFDVLNTPKYAAAAEKSLDYRLAHGSGHTGWSAAWLINLYATLGKGDKAYVGAKKLIRESMSPNLFDMHPPFQIDGNFGFTSGIAQCFVQSHIERAGTRVIQLLPARAKDWKKGLAKGLTTRGGLTVDLKWNGENVSARVKATRAGTFQFLCNGKKQTLSFKSGETKTLKF